MSIVSYLTVRSGERASAEALLERLRADSVRAEDLACDRAGARKKAGERYEGVEDYDPVLRAHCRL